MKTEICGVKLRLTPEIIGEKGSVLHILKSTDEQFDGFGEAYISTILGHSAKDWRRHEKMRVNLVVPVGSIKFWLYDDRKKSKSLGVSCSFILSRTNYYLLTIPPLVWFCFQNKSSQESLLINIANRPHGSETVDQTPFSDFIPAQDFHKGTLF